jgi:DNA-binding Xre family transcriptional regulator
MTTRLKWSAADRKRHKAVRAKVQREKPTPMELMTEGVWLPLGAHFALLEAMQHLKAQRRRRGVSLAELARRTGIDKAALSRLENGQQKNPTLATLTRYAAALGKQVELRLRNLKKK